MLTGRSRRHLVLFDWELSHLNLIAFDSVMAWLMAWRYPAWQSRFRRSALATMRADQNAARAWHLATLSLGIRLAGFAFLRLTNGQPDRYPPLPGRHRATMLKMWHHMTGRVTDAAAALGVQL